MYVVHVGATICIISDDIAALLVDNGLFSCIAVIFANYNSRERVTIACQVVRNILDVSSESVGVKTTEFSEAIMSLYDQVPVSALLAESTFKTTASTPPPGASVGTKPPANPGKFPHIVGFT